METSSPNNKACPENGAAQKLTDVYLTSDNNNNYFDVLVEQAEFPKAQGDSISSENVDIEFRELTLGGRDRMSMVMEESDEDLDENAHPSAEEIDAMLLRNSVLSGETDAADEFSLKTLTCGDAQFNHRRSAISIPDGETTDDHEIATEVDVQRPMGERWGETNYATVLRQSHPHTMSKPYREENLFKVIPVRTAAEAVSVPVEQSNGVTPQILGNHHLTSSSEHVLRVNEPASTNTENDSVKVAISPSDRNPVVKLIQPVIEITNAKTVLQSDKAVVETSNNQTVSHSALENIAKPVVIKSSPPQTIVQPNSDSAAGMVIPSKTYDRTRCFVCTEPVYILEAIHVINRTYHKKCFRCHKCQRVLSVGNYSVGEGYPYCFPHYMEIFRVIGRYEGASMNNYNEYRLRQSAIPSSAPSETEKERPPPQVTRKLVAKFQQMGMNFANRDKRSASISGSETHLNGVSHKFDIYNSPYRTTMLTTMVSPKTPVPTPFQQASQLQRMSFGDDAIQSNTKSETMSRPDRSSSLSSKTSEEDLPNPGITRDMIAKFSALSST